MPPRTALAIPTPSWSSQQIEALDQIGQWLDRRHQPAFYLAGYAGTGKTTIAGEIGRRIKGKLVFAAFTGKAAAVMRKKGCEGARTIDSLIYQPNVQASCSKTPPCTKPPCGERCRYLREKVVGRTLNKESEVKGAKLCVIDEVSMVGERMGRDLLSFNRPVLVLGDTAQLPPIREGGFFKRYEPDFQLTEVHRQALGSPVILLATRVRERRRLKFGAYGDSPISAVINGISDRDMLSFDQIICGTHKTRHRINEDVREALGFTGPLPERGEKILCLKNHRGKGLHNGTIWTVIDVAPRRKGFIEMLIENEANHLVEVVAPEEGFTSWDGNGSDLPEQPFTFGYAITCHKAQGSQWDSVLVVDESKVFGEDRWKWLYTAITRAVERVWVTT